MADQTLAQHIDNMLRDVIIHCAKNPTPENQKFAQDLISYAYEHLADHHPMNWEIDDELQLLKLAREFKDNIGTHLFYWKYDFIYPLEITEWVRNQTATDRVIHTSDQITKLIQPLASPDIGDYHNIRGYFEGIPIITPHQLPTNLITIRSYQESTHTYEYLCGTLVAL